MIENIRQLLALTAWEMEVPKPYGPLHLGFTLVGFTLCALLAWKLRNARDSTSRKIFLSIGIFLLLSEVYKQLMYELVVEPGPGYRWGIFPFHLCSIPMYLCLILPFVKSDRIRRSICGFLMTYNMLGGFISFFEPSGLLHEYWTLTFHALIWHMLLVFLGTYIALSGRGCRNRKDYWGATVTFLVLCAVAFGINCAFWNISGGQINMFFVGPANSSLVVFKQISELLGWYVSTAVYIPATCLGAYVIYLSFRFVQKKLGISN